MAPTVTQTLAQIQIVDRTGQLSALTDPQDLGPGGFPSAFVVGGQHHAVLITSNFPILVDF